MPAFSNALPVDTGVGFPVHYGSHIKNIWSSSQGDNCYVNPSAGNALVVVVFGLKSYPPFDLLHTGNSNPAFVPDLLSFNAPPTISDSVADVAAITNIATLKTALTLSAAATATSGTTVYTGTITGGGANALAGVSFVVAGFVAHTSNNGTFLCTASTTTTLTLSNPNGVAETQAATATDAIATITANNNFSVGDTVILSGIGTATFLNGNNSTVLSASGTTFTTNDLSQHATYSSTADTGKATRADANDWIAVGPSSGSAVLADADYTASLGDFTRSSKWNLDGYYPSIYIFYALNVTAGPYNVNINSVYEDGITRPGQLAAGKPIFDGGVDIIVFEYASVLASGAQDGSTAAVSATVNGSGATVVPSFTTNNSGDLIITAGMMKSGNAFSTFAPSGTTGTTMIAQGKSAGSEAHWGVQAQLQTSAGAIQPGFSNPLGYELTLLSVALKHS